MDARRASLNVREKRHATLGKLRPLIFFVAVAIALATIFTGHAILGWWLLVPIAEFWWLGVRLQRVEAERAMFSRGVAFYQRALARLDGRWAGTGDIGVGLLDDRHLYAKDLDIFGRGSLFELVCNARSPMGREMLAAWLLKPAKPDIIRARQEGVAELAPRLDLRENIAMLGENARAGVRSEQLCAWGERAPILKSSRFRIWAWGLSIFGVTGVIAFNAYLLNYFGLLDLPDGAIVGLRLYFLSLGILYSAVLWRFKKRTNQIIREIHDVAPDLGLISGILGRLEAERFSSPRLVTLRAELDVEGWPPSRRIAKLNRLLELADSRRNMVMAVIRPLLLWDLHLSYSIEDWRRVSGPTMRLWLNAVGEMEAISSIAGYYYEHPGDVFPEFVADHPHFEGKGLGHPFLPADRMVPNDVYLTRELSVLVVSGSNMSGKSTLLRTIGINAVLAQAGAPVRARQLRLSSLVAAASTRIQDSLQENISGFYAEITRLRQIVEHGGGSVPVLFLIDEVLHGTNSHDRRVGAEAIVRGLLNRGAIGLLTTHDLALAHIADILSPRGANVHFEDYLKDGQMYFDYLMRPGVVEKSNAIELMRSVGLEV